MGRGGDKEFNSNAFYLSWGIYYKRGKIRIHRYTNIVAKDLKLTEETRDG